MELKPITSQQIVESIPKLADTLDYHTQRGLVRNDAAAVESVISEIRNLARPVAQLSDALVKASEANKKSEAALKDTQTKLDEANKGRADQLGKIVELEKALKEAHKGLAEATEEIKRLTSNGHAPVNRIAAEIPQG